MSQFTTPLNGVGIHMDNFQKWARTIKMSCFDFSRIFKESAASESFWQLIAILDFNCPGPGLAPDGCGHRGEDPLIIEQSSFIITRFCANERKRLMKGLKYVFDYTWGIIDPPGARGHGQRVSHSSDLIKNNFCLCFMRTESMALRVLFVCNFLLDETFH